jgi:hypothetical protein
MQFDIQPYVGALPITFGMPRAEVHRLLGPPESSHPIWNGSGVAEHYSRARYNVGYTSAGVVDHLGFSPGGAELFFQGRPLWTAEAQPDPNPLLLELDPEPVEFVGFWFFLAIGVTSTGYHDDDPAQRAIAVFPRSKKAQLLAQATAADTSRYRSRGECR